jgi:hypothetical protein
VGEVLGQEQGSGHLGIERGIHEACGQVPVAATGAGRSRRHDVVNLCDPIGQGGDRGLVGHVDALNVETGAGVRAGQIVRVAPGCDNPASVFADG